MMQEFRRFSVLGITLTLLLSAGQTAGSGQSINPDKRSSPEYVVKKEDLGHMASEYDLSHFIDRHITEDSEKHEILRDTLKDITTDPRLQPFRLVLSLEMHIENLLVDRNEKCDPSHNALFEPLLKNYTFERSHDEFVANGKDIGKDTIRIEFMKLVKTKGNKICNYFNHLSCSSSKVCDCKDGFKYINYDDDDGLARADVVEDTICYIKPGLRCENHDVKLFKVSKNGVFISYYQSDTLDQCERPAECLNFRGYGRFCDTSSIQDSLSLQVKFEKKFSIDINGACNPAEHQALFQSAKTFDGTLFKSVDEAQSVIKAIFDKGSRYCRIRQHATCSDEGKCVCLPPTVVNGQTCGVPKNWHCDEVHKSELHKQLENLIVPLYSNDHDTGTKNNELHCGPDHDCQSGTNTIYKKVCICKNRLFGELCDKDASHHLAHLSLNHLPASMHDAEGYSIISDLHDPLTKLNADMRLDYDEPCDLNTNEKLDGIMNFLADVREECNCYWVQEEPSKNEMVTWKCDDSCKHGSRHLDKSSFKDVLKEATALAATSPVPVLCNRNYGLRCVDKKCGCREDYFYEGGRCRVDLGGRCYQLKLDDDYTATCRSGLECSSKNDYKKDVSETRCVTEDEKDFPRCGKDGGCVAGYVSRVKKELVNELENGMKKFDKQQRTLGVNKSCNSNEEAQIAKILSEIELVQKAAESSQNIQSERQQVRELQKSLKSIQELISRGVHVCQDFLVCSMTTNKCEKTHVPKPSFAPEHFQQIRALILNLISASLIYVLQ